MFDNDKLKGLRERARRIIKKKLNYHDYVLLMSIHVDVMEIMCSRIYLNDRRLETERTAFLLAYYFEQGLIGSEGRRVMLTQHGMDVCDAYLASRKRVRHQSVLYRYMQRRKIEQGKIARQQQLPLFEDWEGLTLDDIERGYVTLKSKAV